MKPVSIIFLIVAVVMLIVGLLTCSIASLQAKSQDVQLYNNQIVDGKSQTEFEFEKEIVGKIQISVGNCDVKIVFGADRSKAVLNNFASAGYVCEVQNRALVIEDTINLLNLDDIVQGNIRFDGLRHFLHDWKLTASDKTVTVYVSDSFDLKVIDVTVSSGNVSIEGYKNNTDYTVNVKNGNISISNIKTPSHVTANIKKGNIKLVHVDAKKLNLEAEEGNIYAVFSGEEITAKTQKGDVTLYCEDNLAEYNYSLRAPESTVTLQTLVKSGSYTANDAQLTSFIHAASETGAVKVAEYVPTEEEKNQMNENTETEAEAEETEPAIE